MSIAADSSSLLFTAFEQSRDAVLILDAHTPEHFIRYANPALAQLAATDVATLLGQPLASICPQHDFVGSAWQGSTILASLRQHNGHTLAIEWSLSPLRDAHGQITHQMAVLREARCHVTAPCDRINLLQMALDATHSGVLITDTEGVILFANHALTSQTGYHANEIVGKTPTTLRASPHGLDFYQSFWRNLEHGDGFSAVFTHRHRDGSLLHIEQNITPVTDPRGKHHFISISRDMTQYVAREKALQALAFHDRLTGLHNRSYGEQQLAKAWRQSLRYKRPMSVILADIDHFKSINDTFGHASGDRVLAEFGAALRRSVRSADTLIRWGGEEFLVIIPETDLQTASKLAERIRATIESLHDEEVERMTVSLGVAQLKAEESPDHLVRRADQALYAAKAAGRNRVELAQ